MTTENIALFKALGSKMDFLNQRQRVISQNIANADTPGYRPQDLVPVDFDSVLKDVTNSSKVPGVYMNVTDNGHSRGLGDIEDPKARKQKEAYEVAPAGNAVIMEEQLINAGRTVTDYNLMTNLYQKNIGMMQTALGVQR